VVTSKYVHAPACRRGTTAKEGKIVDRGDELTPPEEQALTEAILRHQIGIDPHQLRAVLDLAAVGVVNSAWRNSPVEDWHAGGGPLDDGDMLRINAHTTWRVRQIMRRWRREEGIAPRAMTDALDALTVAEVDWLTERIFRWMTNRTRLLPTGTALQDLAGDGYDEFRDHAGRVLGNLAATAEQRGAQYALWRTAAHGGLACPHWWGTPTWPGIVDAFLRALDDPTHRHWGTDGRWRTSLDPQPPQVANRDGLQGMLLQRPWDLDAVAARWIVAAGIGYLQHPFPSLPQRTTD